MPSKRAPDSGALTLTQFDAPFRNISASQSSGVSSDPSVTTTTHSESTTPGFSSSQSKSDISSEPSAAVSSAQRKSFFNDKAAVAGTLASVCVVVIIVIVVLCAAIMKRRRAQALVKRRLERLFEATRIMPFTTTQPPNSRRTRWFSGISMRLGRRASADRPPSYSGVSEPMPPRYSERTEVSSAAATAGVPPYSTLDPDEKVDQG